VKAEWFKTYTAVDVPATFEMIFQSWDTANKPTETKRLQCLYHLGH